MEKFNDIYLRAAERKGGERPLKGLLSKPLSNKRIAELPDSAWLSEFTKKIFQNGRQISL